MEVVWLLSSECYVAIFTWMHVFARERKELGQFQELEVSLKHTLTASQSGLEPDPYTISGWLPSGEFTVCWSICYTFVSFASVNSNKKPIRRTFPNMK